MYFLRTVFLTLLVLSGVRLGANILYVSTEGFDTGNCSEDRPCQTIARASQISNAGDIVRVAPGNYPERVTIRKSGSQHGGFITFEGHPGTGCPGVGVNDVNSRGARPVPQVQMRGFVVDANYIKIDCFDITGTGGAAAVEIAQRRSYISIEELYVHDGPSAAVNMARVALPLMAKNVYIYRSYVARSAYGFLIFCGGDCLVQDNEVERNVNTTAGDMDYSRVFGQGVTFRRNYFHDASPADCQNCHIDCFQSFSANAGSTWQIAKDIVIDGNVCMNAHAGFMIEGGKDAEGSDTHFNWTITNNIFRGGPGQSSMAWCALFRNTGQVNFAHNLCASGNVGYRLNSTATHVNNIHFQLGVKPYFAESGSVIRSGGNLLFAGILAKLYTAGFVGDLLNADPRFVNPDTGDFRLLPGSPAIDRGIEVDVKTDRMGKPRPIGSAPDIGPYESNPRSDAPLARRNPPPPPPGPLALPPLPQQQNRRVSLKNK